MEEPRFRRNPGDEPSAVLTREAHDRLRQELERLRTEGRRYISERLLHAREFGDIRENAEFDAAKNEQGLMEARIRELERLLKDPDVVESPEDVESAGPGVLVTVRPLEEEEPEDETYLLAASNEERAPGVRTVSVESPLGKALIGRRPGERVSYEAPGGMFSCQVLGIRPRG